MKIHGARLSPVRSRQVSSEGGSPASSSSRVKVRQILRANRHAAPGIVRRQTIHSSCAGREETVQEAWAEGRRLASQTVRSLENLLDARRQGWDPERISPGAFSPYRNAFGDDVVDNLTDLASRFRSIERGFTEGKILRCDPGSVPKGEDDCEQFAAFVHPDHRNTIFHCPSFFDADRSPTARGVTLVHEMAHSVLGIGHLGGKIQSYSCDMTFGFRYAVARKNAYSYGILVDCLHGEGSQGEELSPAAPAGASGTGAGRSGSRWSLSGGIGLTAGAQRFAAALGGSLSLRSGEYAVWSPRIGLNLLYLRDPAQLAAVTAEVGARIQQPVKGFYFDVSGGGFASFDAPRGLTGTVGLGFRTKRLELGAEARALVPGTDFGSADVLILGRAAVRFR